MQTNLKIGDKVKTEYFYEERDIVRTLTSITANHRYGSGYVASADGGEPCPCCGRSPGTPLLGVDSTHFRKV
jgi:hypothetical protein